MENPMFWPLVGFMVLSVLIGTYTVRFVLGSGKRFLVAGKSMPFIVIGTALAAQSIDGNATLGNTGLSYDAGFWAGYGLPLGLALSLFVMGKFLAGPLNKMDLITLPEFFYRRYGQVTELLVSLITFVTFSILLAGNLAAVGWILSVVAGWSYLTGLIAGAVVIFIYTVAGGLYAAIWTDFLQLHVALIGFAALGIWLYFTQDWQGALAALPAEQLNFTGLTSMGNGALFNWSVIISLGIGNCMALDFNERIYAANSPKTAKNACYYAGVFTLVVGLPATFAGLTAHQLVPEAIGDMRMVLPAVATELAPFWIGVMVMIGVAGASMSTANGGILVTSAVVARNIIQRWGTVKLDDQKLLQYTRVMAIPMTIAGTAFAYYRPDPGLLLVLAFDIVFAGCVVPLFAGVYWRKANAAGAITSIVVGTVARVICFYVVPEPLAGLDTLLPPVISLLAFIPACLLTYGREPCRHHVIGQPGEAGLAEGA